MPPPRRFTIRDLMIAVAAAAVGLTIEFGGIWPTLGSIRRGDRGWDFYAWWGPPRTVAVTLGLFVLAAWLGGPRPPLRRLIRRPGFAAAAVVPAAMAVGLAMEVGLAFIQGPRPHVRYDPPLSRYFAAATERVPAAVLGAWLTLVLARLWRTESSALDRLGRLVGAYWLLWFPICAIEPVVNFLGRLR